jgi:3-oxoacyl-[acyl-carrier protein] reductase
MAKQLLTGGNHGIGAATAVSLAEAGAAVVITYLALHDDPDPGTPEAYRRNRAADGADVLGRVESAGGRCAVVEADLSDAGVISGLFDLAEQRFGGVEILVHNATGWLADTFKPAAGDRLGRRLQGISAATIDQQLRWMPARAGCYSASSRAGTPPEVPPGDGSSR